MFEWLFGKKEECTLEGITCSCNDPVVFDGTTEELLRATQAFCDPEPITEEPIVFEPHKEEETMDQVWTNIEFLKMALEIETSKKQKMIFYVDVGSKTKDQAEAYLKELQKTHRDKDGDFWLPRKEGGRGTELTTAPGRVTVEGVLETAQKLKDFAIK
jgi:hypothetical protein